MLIASDDRWAALLRQQDEDSKDALAKLDVQLRTTRESFEELLAAKQASWEKELAGLQTHLQDAAAPKLRLGGTSKIENESSTWNGSHAVR